MDFLTAQSTCYIRRLTVINCDLDSNDEKRLQLYPQHFPGCSWVYLAWNFHTVMSLPAMSFWDGFCFNRKGGTGGGGWVHLNGANSMSTSGSALETHWLALDGPSMHNELSFNCIHYFVCMYWTSSFV